MRKPLFVLLNLLQLPRVLRAANRGRVLVLLYHGFTDGDVSAQDHKGKHIHVDDFRRHLRYFKSHYNVVSLEFLLETLAAGAALPDYAAVITIDDGYESTFRLAYPILREYGVPATVFVTTDFIERRVPMWPDRVEYCINNTKRTEMGLSVDGFQVSLRLESTRDRRASALRLGAYLKTVDAEMAERVVQQIEEAADCKLMLDEAAPEMYRPLTWEQVSEMADSGLVSIGSHTRTHPILSRCTRERAEQELSQSRETIQRRLGRECDLFAYPNGTASDYNEQTKALAGQSGYRCVLTAVQGLNAAPPDCLEMKRLSPSIGMAEFAVEVSGLRSALAQVRGITLTLTLSRQGRGNGISPSQGEIQRG